MIEPESNKEANRVDYQLKKIHRLAYGDNYFLGYARKPSEIACKNGTETDFYSVSTCMKIPDSLKWASGQPDEVRNKEFCVEYFRGRGMNDLPCYTFWLDRIVCQYNRNCPSGFEMANGISDKCFIVKWADGYKEAKKAKEFCEARYEFCTFFSENLKSCVLYLSITNGFSLFIIFLSKQVFCVSYY